MGKIIRRDETDEANSFRIRFKGIERYHEYTTIRDFTREWRDYDEFMEEEVKPLDKPKSEARRRIDLFLRRTRHIPTKQSAFDAWKARGDEK